MQTGRQVIWIVVWAVLLAASAAAADQSISGFVRDDSGAFVPGAEVTLTHTGIGLVRQTATDDRGFYLFTAIPVGGYTLRVDLESFLPVTVTGIVVEVGDRKDFPVTLEVFAVSVAVEVKAEVEQVELTTSQLDTVISGIMITDLPLNGRNPLDLYLLTPGVVNGSANGNRTRSNNYMLDGMDNNWFPGFQATIYTNVDATAEFRVVTSNPSAEYGRTGGAVIDVVTRSGTNAFHGNAYWFLRDDRLDAKTWQENFFGEPKGDFRRQQFGGSLGGPVVRDNLFFFFNVERLLLRINTITMALVPTQAYRDTVTNPDIARIFAQYYPLPNTDISTYIDENDVAINGFHAFSGTLPAEELQLMAKADWLPSPAHTLSARFSMDPWSMHGLPALPSSDLGTLWRDYFIYQGTLGWTWIVSPACVNDVRVGYTRVSGEEWYAGTDQPTLSFSEWGYSGGDITYFTDFGNGGNGVGIINTGTFEFKDTLSWTMGAHAIKFGFDFLAMQNNSVMGANQNPVYNFEQSFGPAGPNTLANIAAGLTGAMRQGLNGNGREFIPGLSDERGWRHKEYDFFVQDDWRIRPYLTLNLGLRYEWQPAPYEVNGLMANIGSDAVGQGYHLPNPDNYYDPANWDTQTGAPIWVGQGAEFYFPGDGRPLYDAPKTNFAPRAGFSWDPFGDGKTAVRAGYGISYDRITDLVLSMFQLQYPFSLFGSYSPAEGGHSGVWPDVAYFGSGLPVPAVELHLPPETFTQTHIFNTDWRQPYVQTWNVSVQRELWPGHLLSVAYVGSAGVHLLTRRDINQMRHPSPELIQSLADNGLGTDSVPWSVNRYQRQNTQFESIWLIDSNAHSTYHGLQVEFSRRFQAGLQCQANWTWSKALDDNSEISPGNAYTDPYDLAYDRGYSDNDIRHVVNASFIWQLPVGPGRRCGGSLSGFWGALAGGWQVNGIFQARTGPPLTVYAPRDTLGGVGMPRPNVLSYDVNAEGNRVGPTADNFTDWDVDINLMTPKGNAYRGAFRGAGYWNVDFSILKEVRMPWFGAEESTLQFRLEAFNLFNHTNYGVPELRLNYETMGYTYYTFANRQIQLGMKFIF